MRILRIVALALAAALAAGCASTDTRRATGQVIDDASITTRVKTALVREAGIGEAMSVNVDTYRGAVNLSGFVDTQERANRAGMVARNVPGVQSVRNNLQVTGGTRSGASAGSSTSPSE